MRRVVRIAMGVATGILGVSLAVPAWGWVPGTRLPGLSHLSAGETEWVWVPDEGWMFSGNYPDELETAPLNESDVRLESKEGAILLIPPPAGFWTPPPETWLNQWCAAEDAADNYNVTHGHWVTVDSRHDVVEATVKEYREWQGLTMDVRRFREICQRLKQELSTKGGVWERTIQKRVPEMRKKVGFDSPKAIDGGIRDASIFADDDGHYAFTTVQRTTEQDGETTISANSYGLILLGMRAVTLHVTVVAQDESDVASAIATSQDIAVGWMEDIDRKNPGAIKHGTAMVEQMNMETWNKRVGKKEKPSLMASWLANILLYAVIFGVGSVALWVKNLFRGKKISSQSKGTDAGKEKP